MGLVLWAGEWFRLCSKSHLPDLRHRCRKSAQLAHLELFLLDPNSGAGSGQDPLLERQPMQPVRRRAAGLIVRFASHGPEDAGQRGYGGGTNGASANRVCQIWCSASISAVREEW